jgi:nicotinamide-nucleotide adenylyltransferase
MSKPTGLFIGRFQPFHNGHLLVLEGMTKLCGKIWIGIGSSNKHHEKENPFTAQERREMMQRALQGKDLIPMFDIHFVELPDETDDAAWREHVLEKTGAIDVVWTGNKQTKKCFDGVIPIKPIKEVPGISSTNIRRLMVDGGDWKSKIPDDVAMYIGEIDGVNRVKALE